ncbi:MAG: hypothetical protein BWK75_01810 [Candidatus Altiarchaeales archaeon A3]|nr:MAG: hypothetical protein BWK75_01810 [Candidatus Altiarchaeales archaeon A3]
MKNVDEDIDEKIKKAIKEGNKFGDCEIYVYQANSTTANLNKNTISSVESATNFNVGFRIFIDKKQGYVLSNKIDDDIVKRAVTIAKLSKEVDFYGLPEANKEKYKEVDKKILNFELDDVKDFLKIFDEKNTLNEGSIDYGIAAGKILNSNGVECEEEISFFEADGLCIAESNNIRNKDKSTAIDGREERFLFDVGNFMENLKRKAISSLNPKKIKEIPKVVIFNQQTFGELLALFVDNFDARAVDKGESLLTGKINEGIGNLNLTIIDDPLMKNGVNTITFDGEGCRTKRNLLMKDGIVKNFAYDWTMAKKFNAEPTGNAVRGGAGIPAIGFRNIVIDSKNKVKEIFDEYKKVLYICSVSGMHTANALTTEFSVKVDRGFYVENSRMIPLKNFLLSGKVIDMEILGIDGNVENRGGIYAPNAVCKGVNIVA